MSVRAWSWLLLLSAIWGASFLFISIALESFGPAVVAAGRTGGAALLLAPLAWRRRAALAGRWRAVVVVATFQLAVPFLLIGIGQRGVDSGLTGILISTQPIWMVLIAAGIGLGRPNALSVAGIVIGLAGVAALVGLPGAGAQADPAGIAMIMAAAVCYGLGMVLVRRLLPGVNPIAITGATMAVSTVVLAPFAVASLPAQPPTFSAVAALVVLAAVCTAAGFVIYNRLIGEVGAQRASLVAYLSPPFAVAYGATVLAEPVGVGSVVGLALVLLGSWACARGSRPAPVRVPVPVTA
ncbi:DMT family transporter [Pseudonocardia sp. TRM90224]|uniref:DMT family transporter n=1 Tax=Pseudonocardia sp. TRM90224 TaxID=2812678 RepID=UPI001E3B43B3|nr:DMT family transporter [Pseudonocardia sp. TRM90224]